MTQHAANCEAFISAVNHALDTAQLTMSLDELFTYADAADACTCQPHDDDTQPVVQQLLDLINVALADRPAVFAEWTSTGGGCMAIAVNIADRQARYDDGDDRQVLITGLEDVLAYWDWHSDENYDGGWHVGRYDRAGDYVEASEAFITDQQHCPDPVDCLCDHAHPVDGTAVALRQTVAAVVAATDAMLAEGVNA